MALTEEIWEKLPIPKRVELAVRAQLTGRVGSASWETINEPDRETLDVFYQLNGEETSKCRRCLLHKTAQAVCLLGQGPIPCEVMFVGEAPSTRKLESIDKPFSGPAGEVLNTIFKKVGISRSEIYITNAVRCRPPGNRKPKAKEIHACSYWMERELMRVKPKYVVLLGGPALRTMKGLPKSIGQARGKFFDVDGYKIFATYHPGAVFHDEYRRSVIELDLKNFWAKVKNGETPEVGFNMRLVTNFKELKECFDDIRENTLVTYDLETEGLNPWAKGVDIVLCGLGTKKNQWIIPIKHRDVKLFKDHEAKQYFFHLLEQRLRHKIVVAHNGKFDSLWIKALYEADIHINQDTLLMSYLLDENRPNGLKYLSSLFFGVPDYDISVQEKTGDADIYKLAEYNARDLLYTRRLLFKLFSQLKDQNRLYRFYRAVMIPIIEVFRDIEYNGIYINPQQIITTRKELVEELEKVQRKLNKYKKDVNWNSPQQVSQFLFKDLKLKPLQFTNGGDWSTSESVMLRLAKKHDAPKLILRYRELSKHLTTFVDSWLDKRVKNRLHPRFNIARIWEKEDHKGTVTGRLSCEEPNLQQVPRDPKIRSLITAPPGWVFVEADLSQIELRIAAVMADEPVMKRAFQTGEDIHTRTAIMVSGKDMSDKKGFEAKEWRKKAKAVNFGLIYGMGTNGLVIYARDKYDVIFDYDEADEVRERYFKTYRNLRPWHKRQKRLVRMNGYVVSLDGRIRHLPHINSHDREQQSLAERQAINSPVQGLASDLILMAAIEMSRSFSENMVKLVGTVHDSLLMFVKKEVLDEVLSEAREIITKPRILEKLGVHLTVPLEVEMSVGPWSKGEPWKE